MPQTRSPTLNRLAPGPTFSTTPARSQPTTNGSGDVHLDDAAADVRVDRIDRGADADEHLAAGRLGRRQVADDDGFGRARFVM